MGAQASIIVGEEPEVAIHAPEGRWGDGRDT